LASSGGGEQVKRGEDRAEDGKSGNGLIPTEASVREEQESRHKAEDRHKETYAKERSDREKKDHHESHNSKERGHRDSRLAIFS
jgi:hypothetical protein